MGWMLLCVLVACVPAPPEMCDDDADSDGDGLTDCSDPDCAGACDADGDGSFGLARGGDDCDDADAAVFPGAPEVCNGIDDDCDLLVDDADPMLDSRSASSWYADADGDGWGSGFALVACVAPPGGSPQDGDCDDADAGVSPVAVEICGGVDEDCDGFLDDEDPDLDPSGGTTFYGDFDGDGFGDPATPVLACTQAPWLVLDSSDCAPLDPAFHQMAYGYRVVLANELGFATSLRAVDLDSDGDEDLLYCATYEGTISWLENLGVGEFAVEAQISGSASGCTTVRAGDLDGDGDLDVLASSAWDDKISWLPNLGGGLFGDERILSTTSLDATSVFGSDVDLDGDLDVLATSKTDNTLAWFENLGGGVFGGEQLIDTSAGLPLSVVAADLDADGDPDLVLGSQYLVAWVENLGGGAWAPKTFLDMYVEGASLVDVADLDGDGAIDVLSVAHFEGSVIWFQNLGGGAFSSELIISDDLSGSGCVLPSDVDLDGDLDVLSCSWTGAWELVLSRNLGGSFAPYEVLDPLFIVDTPTRIAVADFDGNGVPDLAVTDEDEVLLSRGVCE